MEIGSDVGAAVGAILKEYQLNKLKVSGATHFVLVVHEKYRNDRSARADSSSPEIRGAFFLATEDIDTEQEESWENLGNVEVIAGFVAKKDLKVLSNRSLDETFAVVSGAAMEHEFLLPIGSVRALGIAPLGDWRGKKARKLPEENISELFGQERLFK